jgi:hypothetical protein
MPLPNIPRRGVVCLAAIIADVAMGWRSFGFSLWVTGPMSRGGERRLRVDLTRSHSSI